jgi:nicotinate dehydrogenase subunit A
MVIAAFPIPSWHDFALRLGEVQTRIHNLLTCRGHDDAGCSTAGVSRGNMAANKGARASRSSGERMTISLKVNGSQRSVPADADTPLLYVLRNDLSLNGAKFGCGLAQCGACTVLLDGRAVRSCVTEIGTIGEAEITTIEGLGTVDKPHPLQQAFIDAQAAQCGYCISGMIMTAKDLLDQNPHPTAAEVREALAQNLCRCGTHNRIVRAVLRAAQNVGKT